MKGKNQMTKVHLTEKEGDEVYAAGKAGKFKSVEAMADYISDKGYVSPRAALFAANEISINFEDLRNDYHDRLQAGKAPDFFELSYIASWNPSTTPVPKNVKWSAFHWDAKNEKLVYSPTKQTGKHPVRKAVKTMEKPNVLEGVSDEKIKEIKELSEDITESYQGKKLAAKFESRVKQLCSDGMTRSQAMVKADKELPGGREAWIDRENQKAGA
jgi:hypothetical protein